MKPVISASLACAFLTMGAVSALASWLQNGSAVCTTTGDNFGGSIVSDGAGGAIVAWYDNRSGSYDIYVQRIDAAGNAIWNPNGVALCTATGDQYAAQMLADGAGGAIIAWSDYRSEVSYDVYVARVNASGSILWTPNGVALSTATGNQLGATIVSDGQGGAIVGMLDYRNNEFFADVYARRINAAGTPLWTANGVALCNAAGDQVPAACVTDGSGGAIFTWHDARSGTLDIYSRRVDSAGNALWAVDGVSVCVSADDQDWPVSVSDGAGGAIISWKDARNGSSNHDIFAQRIGPSGNVLWMANGVAICSAANDQWDPAIVSDGAGGAIVVWTDYRNLMQYDVYARRVDASGNPLWLSDGVLLCTANGSKGQIVAVTDGDGGAIAAWTDPRNGADDIYAGRVDANGNALWTTAGAVVCTVPGIQTYPHIVSDDAGGAIVAWSDYRNGDADQFVQRVESRYGFWGRPEPVIESVADVRGDQGGKVAVNWTGSERDVLNLQTITHYSVWRATDPVAAASAISSDPHLLVSASDVPIAFSAPALRIEHAPDADYYWELVGTQPAQYFAGYRFSAATTADSTALGTATHTFQLLAHTANPFTFWPSNALSGHSVDNLAPPAPLFLIAQRAGADVLLKWNRAKVSDLRDYSVYRATSSGVTPIQLNFLSSSDDTVAVDPNAPSSALYYIVTAYDVHANQSDPSNEANVGALTGIVAPPGVTALTVLQNHPNPFNTSTDFEIGLPANANVRVEVFDVAGRRVSVLDAKGIKGWQRVSVAARDKRGQALTSGVYFARVTAAGSTVTKKLVIAR